MLRLVALLAVLQTISAIGSPLQATVELTRKEKPNCLGTCLQSSNLFSVVATATHCLSNLQSGGISLNGKRPIEVIAHPSLTSTSQVDDYDFALAVFHQGLCPSSVPIHKQRVKANEPVVVVFQSKELEEKTRGYSLNQANDTETYLKITNQTNLPAQPSGSGVFTKSGEYLGLVTDCTPQTTQKRSGNSAPSECRVTAPWSENKMASEILEIAIAQGYLPENNIAMSTPMVSSPFSSSPIVVIPSNDPNTLPAIPALGLPEYKIKSLSYKDYRCSSTCSVTYGERDAELGTRDYPDHTDVREASLDDAKRKGEKLLREFCDIHCDVKSYAVSCRLTEPVTCREL